MTKKILVGSFTTESNAGIPYLTGLDAYDIRFGQDCIRMTGIEDADVEGYKMIPSIYANANAAGVIEPDAFLTIERYLLKSVSDHLHEIDGIYLHLHGASYVAGGIGSGDHKIIKDIRALVGPYLPIAVSCDPHGNLTQEYCDSIQILRSYRESPHIDAQETRIKVYKMLCELISERENITAIYRKLPLILGGEQSVSADEPVLSINKYMDELEKDPKVRSASWHVGYLRHDRPEAGCSVVVVPQKVIDKEHCEEVSDKLADYVWQRRHEFHYTGTTASLDEALDMAMACTDKPFTITDSGDNTTSGAPGWNTTILRRALDLKTAKSWLFASIKDEERFLVLNALKEGAVTDITLGLGHDKNSTPVDLKVKVLKKAPVYIAHGDVDVGTLGNGVLVHVEDTNIDIIVAEKTARMTNTSQVEAFGIAWQDYDIVVLKQGYIFPDFKAGSADYVMALTDGATPQDTKNIDFKLVMRPMYPLDDI